MQDLQQMKQLQQRLDQIQDKLESEAFQKNQKLGGEIGFYIFDYPAQYELMMRDYLSTLTDKLKRRDDSTSPSFASIHVFEMMIALLKERNLLDKAFAMQKQRGDEALFKALTGVLDQNRVADFMMQQIDITQCKFILIHGLGSTWPMVRGHGLLNALHAKLQDIPTVLFYPGQYDGVTLKPFGNIDSNHYYRAFKLIP
tara:strand:+ start:4701 stop:5297 length:597 start_codon:yes stop_codon:yes gene_type:complete